MHICLAAAALIEARGLQADPARTRGKDRQGITLHQALRAAAGYSPVAWLGAYLGYPDSTTNYERAMGALVSEVRRRCGRPIEVTIWAETAGQHEVIAALETAADASPGATVPDPPPRLRRGCTTKRVGTLKIGGVLVEALRLAAAANAEVPITELALRAGAGELGSCTNDEFLAGCDRLTPPEVQMLDGDPIPPSDAAPVCAALAELVALSLDSVPHLLDASIRRDKPPTPHDLTATLTRHLERMRAQRTRDPAGAPPGS